MSLCANNLVPRGVTPPAPSSESPAFKSSTKTFTPLRYAKNAVPRPFAGQSGFAPGVSDEGCCQNPAHRQLPAAPLWLGDSFEVSRRRNAPPRLHLRNSQDQREPGGPKPRIRGCTRWSRLLPEALALRVWWLPAQHACEWTVKNWISARSRRHDRRTPGFPTFVSHIPRRSFADVFSQARLIQVAECVLAVVHAGWKNHLQ